MKKNEPESKVGAGYGNPGAGLKAEDLETLREEQKRAEDQARIDALKQINRNKLAQMLGANYLIREWTHVCLVHPDLKRQLSVSEFYPEHSLAVDKFYHFDDWELRLTTFKKKALNDAGFRYVVLTPDKDMSDAFAEIESQPIKAV